MTIKELIKLLQDCDENDLVILAKDSVGNGFSPLSEISKDMYTPESTRSGEVSLRELTPEDEQKGYTQEDVGDPEKGAVNCVTLWPMN